MIAEAEVTVMAPQPRQEMFLESPADIVIFGGAAGGGKSHSLLMDPIRYCHVPGFTAVIFREMWGDIVNPGGLWDSSQEIYPHTGANDLQSSLTWKWESGAKVKFSHFQHPKYKKAWQGSQICMIGWDELTHFSMDIFFYMLSRNRSTCGVRPYIRATCNPDPDSWVKDFIQWWIDPATGYAIQERDGVIRWFVRSGDSIVWRANRTDFETLKQRKNARSVTFIQSKLSDNKILVDKDPQYESNLEALPLHQREALLKGNWNIRLSAGMYWKKEWCEIVDVAPDKGTVVRYWDRASTKPHESNQDPDWTVGVRMKRVGGTYYIEDVVRFRETPDKVRKYIKNTAIADNNLNSGTTCVLEQDPGQAGVAEIDMLKRFLSGFDVRSMRVDKAKEIRFRPFSAQSQAGNVKIVRGGWNREYFSELEAFPPEKLGHDDQCDSSSGAFNYINLAIGSPSIRSL